MQYNYKPSGVCSRNISFEVEDGIVKNVVFTGGCSGNTQGIAKLCEGRKVDEIVELLDGIKCGFKNTSCPDQLSKALKKV
ncbi:MAG: TIGR03905 family TSCPD domain-containing protein [Clostridia bacterium]|nr:TIGR03905 family TSCPD domain-containing protein [Clostridia bacterium]